MKHKCMMNRIGLIQLIPFMPCLRRNEGRSCHTSFSELDFEGIDPLVAAYHQAMSDNAPSQCKRDRGSVLAHERPLGLALKENYSSRKMAVTYLSTGATRSNYRQRRITNPF